MASNNKVLVLFTTEYPYGMVAETFLETEINYLCQAFEQVIIIPSGKPDGVRALPSNAKIDDVLTNNNVRLQFLDYLYIIVFHIRHSFRERNTFKYYRHFRDVIYILKQERKKYRALLPFMNSVDENTLFYDYWYVNSTIALCWLKRKGYLQRLICRAHAYDLYNERSPFGTIFYRIFIAKHINKIFLISEFGKEYLAEHLPGRFADKLMLSRLGVPAIDNIRNKATGDRPLIISVARMMPFKRIALMPEILEKMSIPVKWIHFGAGAQFETVKDACLKIKNPDVQWELPGTVKNEEVTRFYETNNIAAFVLLSTSEGLPVSIMEAIRFGIPVLACNISGMKEIVNEETGVLIDVYDSPEKMANKLMEICQWDDDRKCGIKPFFEKNFLAETNYQAFVKQLENISDD